MEFLNILTLVVQTVYKTIRPDPTPDYYNNSVTNSSSNTGNLLTVIVITATSLFLLIRDLINKNKT